MQIKKASMITGLLGEYECKVDIKGRFMFPVALRKQLGDAFEKGFVINRNLHQKSLVVYTLEEWTRLNKKLSKLNRLIKDNDVFVRKVTGGATAVDADNAGRVLLPTPLMTYAGIKDDIKVIGSNGQVEIWSTKAYNDFLKQELDIETLAEKVMGGINFNDDQD